MVPSLVEPDWEAWERWYPRGWGPSAFSSPAWQRFEAAEAGPDWKLQWLEVPAPGGTLRFPVLARRDRLGRRELRFRPIHFYNGPLGQSELTPDELASVLRTVCTPAVYHAHWWSPPWIRGAEEAAPAPRLAGELGVRRPATFVIPFAGSVEQHLAERVSSTHRRQTRLNDKRGLEVRATGHTPEDVDAYYALYRRTYDDRGWIGDEHPRAMFEAAAHTLGAGGELVLLRHEGSLVGGGVLLYDRNAVYYLQGAVERSATQVFPHVALYRYALEQAERLGVRHVDLGGVPDGNEGLERFKRAWGAEPVPVRVYHWASGPRVMLKRFVREASRALGR